VKSEIGNRQFPGGLVSAIYGLEKFSHLEDKIYRTIEQFKRERQEREALEREVLSLRRELSRTSDDKERLELQVERLLTERDAIKLKVEGMLDAIAVLEVEKV
jgi:chromosome segregation ATPase